LRRNAAHASNEKRKQRAKSQSDREQIRDSKYVSQSQLCPRKIDRAPPRKSSNRNLACVVEITSPVIQLVKIYHETRAARVELFEADAKISFKKRKIRNLSFSTVNRDLTEEKNTGGLSVIRYITFVLSLVNLF
jgi:hypothetical protein